MGQEGRPGRVELGAARVLIHDPTGQLRKIGPLLCLYQRRRQDAEGEFFRKVADQGPRKGKGGATRQGIYCFTASGSASSNT